jgi:hypothetical protein
LNKKSSYTWNIKLIDVVKRREARNIWKYFVEELGQKKKKKYPETIIKSEKEVCFEKIMNVSKVITIVYTKLKHSNVIPI